MYFTRLVVRCQRRTRDCDFQLLSITLFYECNVAFHISMQLTRCVAIIILRLLGSMVAASCEGSITVAKWGSIEGRSIEKYTLKNKSGQEVDIVTYGATITSVRTPDKHGNIADVVLGFDNIEGYLSKDNPYFGATVGRVANRIGGAEFVLNGTIYRLAKNSGKNSLHGGFKGWNSKIWNATIQGDRLVLSLLSEDGDEGYPGAAIASITFQLTTDGELRIEMKAFVTKPTPVNLTNHSYFNLAGHNTNSSELYKHRFTLNADRWTVTDTESIPTGEIRPVEGSLMDLRNSTTLGDVIDKLPAGGYDYNFCVTNANSNEKNLVAKVEHPASGRRLEVFSNQPGVQFYTANFLPAPGTAGVQGKNGSAYFKHAAFCLETQNYPDAVNHENFPNSILEPGQIYLHTVVYKFGVVA
ncbi:galactose mutarotase-like isoform X1 [Osmia bicornis bicornis]|uniref:galactose mutarotase-like isoform X1 n=2 Tax=Osmia bicornis bicornis TaxID=1437191 RepID=UPI001EAF7434|nr:galactose mutarotase-like isoform X1 [Osmia bicornis bicornis]